MSHQYVLVEELAMEVTPHSIVDKPLFVFLLQTRLVPEDRVLVPPTNSKVSLLLLERVVFPRDEGIAFQDFFLLVSVYLLLLFLELE